MTDKHLVATVLTIFCAPLLAEQAAEPPQRNWKASAELGFNITSGNTDTASLNTRVEFKQDLDSWRNDYSFKALQKNNKGKESANNWTLSGKGRYDNLAQKNAFIFVEAIRKEDRFGVFDNHNSLALGYGQRFHESETMYFDADIGPGYVFYKRNGDHQQNENSSTVQASAVFNWVISDSATFHQKVKISRELSDLKNTRTQLDTSLTARINGALHMKLSLNVINNSAVQATKKNTDTVTSVTLVYTF